jgi:hypothetical protein
MQSGTFLGDITGLRFHEGKLAGLPESGRRELATSVAIDAGGVDEECSLHILANGVTAVRHSNRMAPGVRWFQSPGG